MAKKIVVSVRLEELDNPGKNDSEWKVYIFDVDREFEDSVDPEKLNATDILHKMGSGLAFSLDFSSHGPIYNVERRDFIPDGEEEFNRLDGVVIWENDEDDLGPKSGVDRAKDADSFLSRYTAWVNGDCYSYWVKVDGLATPSTSSCVYGRDELIKEINLELSQYPWRKTKVKDSGLLLAGDIGTPGTRLAFSGAFQIADMHGNVVGRLTEVGDPLTCVIDPAWDSSDEKIRRRIEKRIKAAYFAGMVRFEAAKVVKSRKRPARRGKKKNKR